MNSDLILALAALLAPVAILLLCRCAGRRPRFCERCGRWLIRIPFDGWCVCFRCRYPTPVKGFDPHGPELPEPTRSRVKTCGERRRQPR